jgi:hypothetical protein
MDANDNTSVLDDIAVSADYSVTLKDDGKPLYRWGGLIKRPNDIRMYARLALPEEWKEPNADFVVTKAHLIVNHWITNNPNDQLRPEDLENEAATGLKPDYRVFDDGAVWKSTKPCYEGDADLIDDEEGTSDPTVIGVGTYFKNMPFALTADAVPGVEPGADPYAFSADLTGAVTNGYYTTIERDPFEWSYLVDDGDDTLFEFVGSPLPDDTLGELVSGPRWRLKANKFGQDIPGLEIPLVECSPPPFTRDNIKYSVGEPVTTVINLLDWEDENGPLATSKGWVDLAVIADPDVDGRCMLASNPNVTIVNVDEGTCTLDGPIPITSNGLPMTNDFDLAVYVKGDRKATVVYNAYLDIEYEGDVTPPVDVIDAALTDFEIPSRIEIGEEEEVTVRVTNVGEVAPISGTVTVTGTTNRGGTVTLTGSFEGLDAGEEAEVKMEWVANQHTKPYAVSWTAVVAVDGDENATNDTATASTKVRR